MRFTSFLKFNIISNFLLTYSNGMKITILNKCPWNMDIYNHNPITRNFDHVCIQIKPQTTCMISIDKSIYNSGLIKNIRGEQATLFEFSKTLNGIWYDISVIPPGSGVCYSWDECFNKSKKRGFNDALNVIVDQDKIPANKRNNRCKNLFCRNEKCPDGYLFPYDDLKTFFCDINTEFRLEYC